MTSAEAARIVELEMENRARPCGQCGSRLTVSNAKNRHGNVHCYFVCSGRHSKRTDCTRGAILIEDAEKLIEDYYARVQISPAQRDALSRMLHTTSIGFWAAETDEIERLTKHRDRLEHEQDRLMQAHYADARVHLDGALNLLADCADIYRRCDDANRRLCNQAFFTEVYVDESGELRVENNRPFEMLLDTEVNANALNWVQDSNKDRTRANDSLGEGSSLVRGVEPRGLEPLTPCLQSRCATNCAMAPCGSGAGTHPGAQNRSRRHRSAPKCRAAGASRLIDARCLPGHGLLTCSGRRRPRRRAGGFVGELGPQVGLGALGLDALLDGDGPGGGSRGQDDDALHVPPLRCGFRETTSPENGSGRPPVWEPPWSVLVELRVGLTGLEPVASSLSGKRSNRLSYRPGVCVRRALDSEGTQQLWEPGRETRWREHPRYPTGPRREKSPGPTPNAPRRGAISRR